MGGDLICLVQSDVAREIRFVDECLVAEVAHVGGHTSVDLHMRVQGVFVSKGFVALLAGKHLDITMSPHVHFQCVLHPEGLVADLAAEASFARVLQIVSLQCKQIVVRLRALVTHELGALTIVEHQMAVQRLFLHEALFTLVAFVWLFWSMNFHVVLECPLQGEGLTAHGALERPKIRVVRIMALKFCTYGIFFRAFVTFKLFICSMRIHVLHKCTLVYKRFLAEVTYKWFLSRVQCVVQVMFLSCFKCLITLIARISI